MDSLLIHLAKIITEKYSKENKKKKTKVKNNKARSNKFIPAKSALGNKLPKY